MVLVEAPVFAAVVLAVPVLEAVFFGATALGAAALRAGAVFRAVAPSFRARVVADFAPRAVPDDFLPDVEVVLRAICLFSRET